MIKFAARTLSVLAVSSLPLTATLAVTTSAAFAKGKPETAGKPENTSKPENTGKPDKPDKPADTGKDQSSPASAMKSLNSLKRNINGLMNSIDPKLEGFRSYLLANEALQDAETLLAIAKGEFDAANAEYKAAYDALDLSGHPGVDLAALQTTLDGLVAPDPETATEEEIAAYNQQVEDLTAAMETIETYQTEYKELDDAMAAVIEASAGTTEEDLLQAFVEAMHASGQTDFTVDDITDEMLALFQSHIDNYLN